MTKFTNLLQTECVPQKSLLPVSQHRPHRRNQRLLFGATSRDRLHELSRGNGRLGTCRPVDVVLRDFPQMRILTVATLAATTLFELETEFQVATPVAQTLTTPFRFVRSLDLVTGGAMSAPQRRRFAFLLVFFFAPPTLSSPPRPRFELRHG